MTLDCLITGARIVDPESGRDFAGSLGIASGKIAAILPEGRALPNAARVVDAGGGILVPGFIDVHAHTDSDLPCAEKFLAQGITTALSGNCGFSPVNLAEFFAAFERTGYPINQAEQIGHTDLRSAVGQSDVYVPATQAQIDRMKVLIQNAHGAWGLSFGLEYAPGAPPEEVLELARAAVDAGRLISIHIRSMKVAGLDSLKEALELAVKTGGRVIVSHLVYMYNGPAVKQAVAMIAAYQQRGFDVWADSGVYTAFSTYAGTPVFDEEVFTKYGYSFDKRRAATGTYAGQILDRAKYREVRRDSPGDSFIYEPGTPQDIYDAYTLPSMMVSTDGGKSPPGEGHPQTAATFPRFFRMMVKSGRMPFLDGLRRCTLIPANALRLPHKGRIAEGADADLVVLDWDRLEETADFPGSGDPGSPPRGVRHVFVNGVQEIENEKRIPGVLAGMCLKSSV
jgi:N-acyl-D-amino-acid deacylase